MVKAKRQSVMTGKPTGVLHPRVQAVGPEHFGIVCVDPAKRSSKWNLCNFYGKVLVPPIEVKHTAGDLAAAVTRIRETMQRFELKDLTVGVERTGCYHLPVKRAFQKHFEVRIIHPFTTKQYRLPADPDDKTDDNDLAAMQRACVNGLGLLESALDPTYQTLQLLARHRRDLVQKNSSICCQMLEHLAFFLPGLESCVDSLWESSLALWVARRFTSPRELAGLPAAQLEIELREHHIRFQKRSLEKFRGWAALAPEADRDAAVHHGIFVALEEDRCFKLKQILDLERQLAGLLAQTPYVRLLVFPGVNVISAAELAGEMGPIAHYAAPRNITGRSGLFPSRYQSDQVDLKNGHLVRSANRRLRAIILLIADNLIACNKYFGGLAAAWEAAGKNPKRSRVKVASRFCRIAYHLLAKAQPFVHPSIREYDYILAKLWDFHLDHGITAGQMSADLRAAITQLAPATYAAEAAALAEKKPRVRRPREVADSTFRKGGPQSIGEILPWVLATLKAGAIQLAASGGGL